MAYDEKLDQRFANALGKRDGISSRRMMGGICYMHNGNMIGGADRSKDGVGRFMFRVGKDNEAQALTREGAIAMEQGGRRMTGMVFVNESQCDDKQLKSWIKLCMSFVGTLPAK